MIKATTKDRPKDEGPEIAQQQDRDGVRGQPYVRGGAPSWQCALQ